MRCRLSQIALIAPQTSITAIAERILLSNNSSRPSHTTLRGSHPTRFTRAMRLPILLLMALLSASAAQAAMPGSSCASDNPENDGQYECCVDKAASAEDDDYCMQNWPELYEDDPPVGTTCDTVTPGQNEQCCKDKIAEGVEDTWCEEEYPELYNLPGSSCASDNPENDGQYECCVDKAASGEDDDYCMENWPELYESEPPVGTTCDTVTPGQNKQCCKDKIAEGVEDKWCEEKYPELYNRPGSSCASVNPKNDGQYECCVDKAASGEDDDYCMENWPELYETEPPVGTTCDTVTPGQNKQCCKDKIAKGVEDKWCEKEYPELYEPDVDSDYPWMALVKGPFQDCGGSLIAPGYVLTAAQCVFKDGKAAEAKDVSVWVNGEWFTVDSILVNQDKAQFQEFANSKSENSWDMAMLALSTPSSAQYVALPLSDEPSLGDWVEQMAWKEQTKSIETAELPVWDGCPPAWTDLFCVGGSGFLQTCPGDKGSPLLEGSTQVGLASGAGCDGMSSNYGYFLRLADKGVLEQITVWLNSREGTDNTGLDDNVRAWLQEANSYLYGRR